MCSSQSIQPNETLCQIGCKSFAFAYNGINFDRCNTLVRLTTSVCVYYIMDAVIDQHNLKSAFGLPRLKSRWRIWGVSAIGLVAWVFLLSVIIYQRAAQIDVSIGDYYDTPYLSGAFSDRETSADGLHTFRWTTGAATIAIPNGARGSWVANLNILTSHPDSSPVQAVIRLDDEATVALPDVAERRIIHLLVPDSATSSGNLRMELTSNVYQEPTASARTLGVALFGFAAKTTLGRPLFPPPLGLLLLTLAVVFIAITLYLTGLPEMWSVGVAASVGAGLALPLMFNRMPTVFWLPGLVTLSALSLLFILILRKLIPWLFAKGGIPLDSQALTILLLIFTVGFWIKAGGQLYPYMIAIDVHWHMERVRWILNGRLAEIYRPGAFNESVMPVSEWGENRPTIPYSPFFHIFATSFNIFPWALETTAKVFSAFIDTSRTFIIYGLVGMLGLKRRTGLLAAGLYAVFPATFLLHSWGNVPTTFGMWWTLITSIFIIGAWGKLRTGKMFGILTLLLLITFLIYTVMAVYLGMVLIVWLILLAWRYREQRPQVWAVVSATTVASSLALAIYYGQYIPEIVQKTLPYFGQTLTQGQESVGATPFEETYGDYLVAYIPRLWHYGLLIPVLLAPIGIWLIRRQRPDATPRAKVNTVQIREPSQFLPSPRRFVPPLSPTVGEGEIAYLNGIGAKVAFGWMLSILAVSLIFVPIARSVPMVDKNVFFAMPVLAILCGAILERALEQPRWMLLLLGAWYVALLLERLFDPTPLTAQLLWLWLALPLVTGLSAWLWQTRWRRPRWTVIPVAVGYIALLIAALDLWVYRIEIVKQLW